MNLDLFDPPCVALQVWRLAPECANGMPSIWGTVRAPGWTGCHHCFWCYVQVMRVIA